MYDYQLRVYGEYLAKDQTMPANTKVMGNGGNQLAGGQLGAAEIIITAASAVTLAAAKSLTLSLETGTDDTFFVAMPVTFKLTCGANAKTWGQGDIIGRLALPSDCERYVRAFVATDDATASGKFDVTFAYLPR